MGGISLHVKKVINFVAAGIIGLILCIAFLGTGLSYSAGKPFEPGVLFFYIALLVLFVATVFKTFGEQEGATGKTPDKRHGAVRFICYAILGLAILAFGFSFVRIVHLLGR